MLTKDNRAALKKKRILLEQPSPTPVKPTWVDITSYWQQLPPAVVSKLSVDQASKAYYALTLDGDEDAFRVFQTSGSEQYLVNFLNAESKKSVMEKLFTFLLIKPPSAFGTSELYLYPFEFTISGEVHPSDATDLPLMFRNCSKVVVCGDDFEYIMDTISSLNDISLRGFIPISMDSILESPEVHLGKRIRIAGTLSGYAFRKNGGQMFLVPNAAYAYLSVPNPYMLPISQPAFVEKILDFQDSWRQRRPAITHINDIHVVAEIQHRIDDDRFYITNISEAVMKTSEGLVRFNV